MHLHQVGIGGHEGLVAQVAKAAFKKHWHMCWHTWLHGGCSQKRGPRRWAGARAWQAAANGVPCLGQHPWQKAASKPTRGLWVHSHLCGMHAGCGVPHKAGRLPPCGGTKVGKPAAA